MEQNRWILETFKRSKNRGEEEEDVLGDPRILTCGRQKTLGKKKTRLRSLKSHEFGFKHVQFEVLLRHSR